MWGSWFGLTVGGVFVVLLIVGVAFGTSALLLPVLIAVALAALAAGIYIAHGAARGTTSDAARRDPRRSAAPVSGEGSVPGGDGRARDS